MVSRTRNLSNYKKFFKSKKAQFYVLTAFAIVSILYLVSTWIEPYTIIDTSSVALMEESFIFNNIVEKTQETIKISKNPDDLKFNIQEYKQFVQDYGLRKNLKITFDISNLKFGNPTTGYILIQMSSPRMTLNRILYMPISWLSGSISDKYNSSNALAGTVTFDGIPYSFNKGVFAPVTTTEGSHSISTAVSGFSHWMIFYGKSDGTWYFDPSLLNYFANRFASSTAINLPNLPPGYGYNSYVIYYVTS